MTSSVSDRCDSRRNTRRVRAAITVLIAQTALWFIGENVSEDGLFLAWRRRNRAAGTDSHKVFMRVDDRSDPRMIAALT
jgi:hypothetical protein